MSLMAAALVLLAAPEGVADGAPAPMTAPPPRVHVVDEKERVRQQQTDVVRLSLPTQEDLQAWDQPGLRVALAYGYGRVNGDGPAPSFPSHSFGLRPSVRLDEFWSAGLGLFYGTGPQGVRWSMTVEPTFHPLPGRQLSLTVGAGYGGGYFFDLVPYRDREQYEVSRDVGGNERLRTCTGSGLSTLARADHLFVVGPIFATGPFLQVQAQWTRCQEILDDLPTERETGRYLVHSQWWRQTGATLGWWFVWR